MNTYGKTNCPKCYTEHRMYRPLDLCRKMPAWDSVECRECGTMYKHSDKFNNVKTESQTVRENGGF
jgi:hypothetical protein